MLDSLNMIHYYCQRMPDPVETMENLMGYLEENAGYLENPNRFHPLQNVHVLQLLDKLAIDHVQNIGCMLFGASYQEREELEANLTRSVEKLNQFWRGIFRLKYEMLDFQIYSPNATAFVIKFVPLDVSTYYPLEMAGEIRNIFDLDEEPF